MDKKQCNSCGASTHKCSCKNKEFTKAVVEINNPGQTTLMRKVVIPVSMGDDTTVPPAVGKYHNVLLYYEANSKSYLYSSDGIPTQLVNGFTNYEEAINLPQINGVTLLGDKSAADLELADAPMVITVANGNTSWSGANTAADVYDFFLNKGKVNIIFNGEGNHSYEIASAAYIPGEEKMMCTLAVATIATGETSEFEGNALFGTMTLYTADKAIDVSQIELQPKLFVTDFTGLDLSHNELSGVPATTYSIGMVKAGDGLEVDENGTLSGATATTDSIGMVKPGTGLEVASDGTLSVYNNKLSGKKLVACGDSFTSYTNATFDSGPYSGKAKTYPYLIGLRNDMVVVNKAVGGSTMAKEEGASTRQFAVDIYNTLPEDADYILIKYGINDETHEIPVGTINDATDDTFYGAWNKVLSYIIEHHPLAKIGIIVTNGLIYDADAPEGNSYAKATMDVASKFGIPTLNEWNDPNVPLLTQTGRSDVDSSIRDLRDTTFKISISDRHPNYQCQEYESMFVEDFLRRL